MPSRELKKTSRVAQKRRNALRDQYIERYRRIKDETRTILNTLIGLSGGSIVLSITFLDKLAPTRRFVALIIVAWFLFGLPILVSVYGLIKMIYQSQKFQRKLERILDDPDHSDEILFGPVLYTSAPPPRIISRAPQYLSGLSFAFGVLALAAFGVINLLTR